MEPKKVLTISRSWHHPEIFSKVCNEKISLSISLDDFKQIVKDGLASVYLRKSSLDKDIDRLFDDVVSGVKEESAKVV